MTHFPSITHIRHANERLGHHFFDADTLRFFQSRVYSAVYGGRFFVTSERAGFDDATRVYTIRRADADGSIHTVGEIGEYDAKCAAMLEARYAARDAMREYVEPGDRVRIASPEDRRRRVTAMLVRWTDDGADVMPFPISGPDPVSVPMADVTTYDYGA